MEGCCDPSAHMKGERRGGRREERGGARRDAAMLRSQYAPCFGGPLGSRPHQSRARLIKICACLVVGCAEALPPRASGLASCTARRGTEVVYGELLRSKRTYKRREKREWREERGARGNVCIFAIAPAPRRAAWCGGAVQAARRLCWSCGSRRSFTIKVLPPPRRRLQDLMRKEIGSRL